MRGSHRVEVHVYAPEWFSLMSECSGAEREEVTGIDPLSLTSMATQLLIMISKHVQTLACDWFSGTYIQYVCIYMYTYYIVYVLHCLAIYVQYVHVRECSVEPLIKDILRDYT